MLQRENYILYRDSIIKALDDAIIDVTKKEKFIHDIFMPMRTTTFSSNQEKHLLGNLWLLDDKFMTYSYAASDETMPNSLKRRQNGLVKAKNLKSVNIIISNCLVIEKIRFLHKKHIFTPKN